jgi:hypothetical protein
MASLPDFADHKLCGIIQISALSSFVYLPIADPQHHSYEEVTGNNLVDECTKVKAGPE